jgi:hypothetical protein
MTGRTFDSSYKRRRDNRLTVQQVHAAHRLYVELEWSLRTLGRELYQQFGYANAHSCANSLHEQFIAEGLPRRDRIQATIKASTTHGLRPRSGARSDEYNELRRQRRDRQPGCAGVRVQHPRKGDPCENAAMTGSPYCFSHAPETAELREMILINARAHLVAV